MARSRARRSARRCGRRSIRSCARSERQRRPNRMPPLRIGVIGCGQIARAIHLPVLGRIADARVVALSEPVDASRLAAAAMAPGGTAYSDYRDMLEAGGLDAVVI